MDCREVEKNIDPFIQNTLQVSEIGPFLEHIEECPQCFNELDIRYMMSRGLQCLDDESITNYDFRDALITKLEREKKRYFKAYRNAVFAYTVYTLAFWSLFYTGFVQLRLWLR